MLRYFRWLGSRSASRRLSGTLGQKQRPTAHIDRERQLAGWRFVHTLLPSIGTTVPVTCAARSSASHSAKSATSPGLTHLEKSALGMDLRFTGVSIVPGKITFAVSPASLFSSATVRTS